MTGNLGSSKNTPILPGDQRSGEHIAGVCFQCSADMPPSTFPSVLGGLAPLPGIG